MRLPGRVVNVAADLVSHPLDNSVTLADLENTARGVTSPLLNFITSKMLHAGHAFELAVREPEITAIAVNPGYAIMSPQLPQALFSLLLRSPLTARKEFLERLGLSEEDAGFVSRG